MRRDVLEEFCEAQTLRQRAFSYEFGELRSFRAPAYRAANRDAIQARDREAYATDAVRRAQVRARVRQWAAANPDQMRERKRKWRERNLEHVRAYHRAYYLRRKAARVSP